MSVVSFDTMPGCVEVLRLAILFGVGFALGILNFRSLWWSAHRLVAGRERLAKTIAFMIGRFMIIGTLLALVSLEGALPLLTMALGVLVARFAVIKRIREAAP